jgi:hypothetical protein
MRPSRAIAAAIDPDPHHAGPCGRRQLKFSSRVPILAGDFQVVCAADVHGQPTKRTACASGNMTPLGMIAPLLDCAARRKKTAAHFCGRVLRGAIHVEQNTLFHWTSQAKFEVVFYRCCPRAMALIR